MSKFRFIDLFAGTGGMRLAIEQALKELGVSHECVFSSEIDKKACETYELNFGEVPSGDIKNYINKIPVFDFLLAGFPCQAFSYAGKQQGFGDTRGTLFFEVEKILKNNKPKGFLLENVRGLTTHDKGRTFKTILHSLNGLGYKTAYFLCNSSNFNVPQNRVRIYIVGILGDDIRTNIVSNVGAPDSHKHKNRTDQTDFFYIKGKPKTVSDILQTNVDSKYYCSDKFAGMLAEATGNDFERLHGVRLIDTRGGNSLNSWDLGIKGRCTKEERFFMKSLISNRRKKVFGTHQDGKMLTLEQIKTFYKNPNVEKIILSLMKKKYLKCVDGKYNPLLGNMSFEIFKFLDPESISITLTSSDANRLGVIQDGRPRRITPREAARLQGFPDSYILHPTDNATYKQMGNAVSVPVVKAILHDLLKNNSKALLKKSRISISKPTTVARSHPYGKKKAVG